MNKTVADYLIEHKNDKPVWFHMPGHKGRSDLYEKYGYGEFANNTFAYDITEIPGADALAHPQDVIRQTMVNYADLYGARYTDLLVNGSSNGLIASILATVPRGGKIIVGRNSHKSVFSAMRLAGVEPVYVKPEIYPGSDLQGAIPIKTIEKAMADHPDAAAVLITSPNYYGALSDIRGIADIVHRNDKILIVDQAHGAHLKFFDRFADQAEAAENLGADIVINSTHKTLLTFTGTAIVNVCTDRVDIENLADTIRMIQTTSPSYLMMASMDINEKILRQGGDELIHTWKEDLRYFYTECRNIIGLDVIDGPHLDRTKINITMRRMGLDGDRLEEELRRRNIWVEMVHGDYVMLMTGLGSRREDYDAALAALESISEEYGVNGEAAVRVDPMVTFELELRAIPKDKERIPLYQAEGRVAFESLVPYPPGVPLVCPGEVFTYEAIQHLQERIRRGQTVLGVDDEGCILAGPED